MPFTVQVAEGIYVYVANVMALVNSPVDVLFWLRIYRTDWATIVIKTQYCIVRVKQLVPE